MSLFKKRNEFKNASEGLSGDLCPNCSGKGFYQHGLEFVCIYECSVCDGSGLITEE